RTEPSPSCRVASYGYLRRLSQRACMSLTNGSDHRGEKLVDLLRSPTDKAAVRQHSVEVDASHEWIRPQSVKQIVSRGSGLQSRSDGMAMSADALVNLLSIAARGDGGHHHILRRHVWQRAVDIRLDDLRIHHQSV